MSTELPEHATSENHPQPNRATEQENTPLPSAAQGVDGLGRALRLARALELLTAGTPAASVATDLVLELTGAMGPSAAVFDLASARRRRE